MKSIRYCLAATAAVLIAGCSNPGSEPVNPAAAQAPVTQDATAVPVPGADELPVGALIAQPLLLANGGVAALTIKAPKAGSVGKLGVQIGNFAGVSDGNLAVELCVGTQCVRGTEPLAGSADNAILNVRLDDGLKVQAGDQVAVKVSKAGGAHDVALWLYESDAQLQRPDLTSIKGTPKLRLTYR